MKSDERALRELVDHTIPTPSDSEMESRCDRVLQELQSGNPAVSGVTRLQPEPIHSWQASRIAFVCAAVAAAIILAVFLRMPGAPAELEDVAGSRKIEFGEVVRSGVLGLADSSRVEIRANSELLLERADDGVRIHLSKGSVLVTAAKQRNGHLYVQTKDLVVSVTGTVFEVKVEEEGSRVAVIEGEVRVKYREIEKILRKGEQITTTSNPEKIQLTALQPSTGSTIPTMAPPQRSTAAPARPSIVGDYWASVVPPPGAPGGPPSSPQPQPVSNVRPGEVPKWEAVSIRPCPTAPTGGGERGRGGSGPWRFSSDRMNLNCLTVRSLIRSAYHVYPDPGRPGITPMNDVLADGVGGGTGRKNPTDGTEGGPDWLDTDSYTIEAKAEVVTDRALMQGPMLQAILEERFKIKVHKENKEIAVDALTIANGVSKLKPFVEGTCVREPARDDPSPRLPRIVVLHIKADANGKLSASSESGGQVEPLTDVRVDGQTLSFSAGGDGSWKGAIENNGASLNGVLTLTRGGPMPLVFTRVTGETPAAQRYCRNESGRLIGSNNRKVNFVYNAEGFTIDEFAKLFLTEPRGRYVIDKTGLAGKFDIHLEEEISAEDRKRRDPNGDFYDPSTAPPLPQALQQQLGLKLESTKGGVELLIIDYIERPSEN